MQYTKTVTRAATVSATEARVRAVLAQVRVDLLAAEACGILPPGKATSWLRDLAYMLENNALEYFEIRIAEGGEDRSVWRYVVSDDGRLAGAGQLGGGINFYEFSRQASVSVIIRRRSPLAGSITAEIDRRGWTVSVQAIAGSARRDRVYERDGYGVERYRIDLGS